MGYETITVTPMTPNIGGLVAGIDLTRPLGPETVREMHDALMQYQVLFFRGQKLTHETQKALGAHFGRLHVSVGGDGTNSKPLGDHPEVRALHFDADSNSISGNETWHTDQSCLETPPMGTILYIHTVPPKGGGDTLFASMYAAYDGLSPKMKHYLEGMTALHDGAAAFARTATNRLPVTEQPVIAKHPVTGRRLIYVNPLFTTRMCGVPRDEGDAILSYLYRHCANPEFNVRFRWEPHSIAFWDNRCTHHLALWDYYPHTRSGFRIQVTGTDRVIPG
ncbi:MAG: TauD/TfdA dioxygenase family protein [Rhodospirillales bacterium]